jgi:hypothetical protein
MESEQIPNAWVGHNVRIELRDADPLRAGGSRFDSRTGSLQEINELGIVIELPTGSQETIRFYPWSAVRSITAL